VLAVITATSWNHYNPAGDSDAILGRWIDAREEMIVEFYRCTEEVCGRIIELPGQDTDAHDLNNPDPALRSRSLVGHTVIEGLQYDGCARWAGGKMYAPSRGVTVRISFEMTSPEMMTATASKLLFRRSIEWRRVE
jgi:uncharacterized protein (DUF2147 family)